MVEKSLIENLSHFTKISSKKIESFLEENSLRTLIEHPEAIRPTQNQLKNLKDLTKLHNSYEKLNNYKQYQFKDTLEAIPFLKGEFDDKYNKEHFIVAYLDKGNKLLGSETISIGTLNASIVHPRDVMKKAIQYDSDRLILSHNHPSGDPTPSREDRMITSRLSAVADTLDKKIIDHIIIGRNNYYSFREQGDLTVDYSIQKTKNNNHLNIYKNNIEKHIELLNKFTKIPKTKLKNILRETSIEAFHKSPQSFLENKKHLDKINKLDILKTKYNHEINPSIQTYNIGCFTDVQDYINTKYKDYDNLNAVLYLDTKNNIIESEMLPKNMSFKKEAKYILENAMLYDSNAFLLSSKSYNIDPMQNRSRISALKREADLAGIKLLDNVEISKSNSLSYKQEKILEIQGKYRKGKSQIKDKNKEQNNNKPKFSIRNLNDKSKEVNNNQKNKQTIKRNPIKSI